MAEPTTNALTYAEFGTWYDEHRSEVLEPALESGLSALESTLEDGLTDRELSRIRSVTGRVKSKRRTWRKMQQSQYQGSIRTTDDIPRQINDLVGLRITCTNLRDIETVQAVLQALPPEPTASGTKQPNPDKPRNGKGRGFWADMSSEQDYVRAPKESGYRGWHVRAGIRLDTWSVNGRSQASPGQGRSSAKNVSVGCELQVRTLLQDSWGELTHEDTYSKDGELPPLVEVLSKRIADLFATLDDIAEDLRTELDRIDEAAVAEGDESTTVPDPLIGSGQAADAASMLLDRWQRLERPIDLASMAWAVQREFGAEISDDWFGYRSFKRFLAAAVPNGEISTGNQAYLLPFNNEPREEPKAATSKPRKPASHAAPTNDVDWTEAAAQLRAIDRSFPVLETETWRDLYEGLAEAWRRIGEVEINQNVLNRLTRSARDRAEAGGRQLSRRHLDYVARAVVATDTVQNGERRAAGKRPDSKTTAKTAKPMSANRLADQFAARTVQRMIDLRIIDADDDAASAAIVAWLTGR